MRGDDPGHHHTTPEDQGTAPRARGRPHPQPVRTRRHGNSPACAGTTSVLAAALRIVEEQPRVRGDDPGVLAEATRLVGTAPRARGRQQGRPRRDPASGNSPACAGTTLRAARPGSTEWEQPRVRGDDPGVLAEATRLVGTAPRARGRQQGRPRRDPASGNSPACAGTTLRAARPGSTEWEQPRVRGDDPLSRPWALLVRNSPACAGTTREAVVRAVERAGTAPRARGRRDARSAAWSRRRNSPACAGTTA